MIRRSSGVPGHRLAAAAITAAASLIALACAYAALCLVVLYRPDWLPSDSILMAALVGTPGWLVWGPGARSAVYGSTLAFLATLLVGASFRPLLLPCALLGFLIWLGSGFISVSMSI